MGWPEVLPVLAERVAADTGRDAGEVAEFLNRMHHAAEWTAADAVELVDTLAPTMAGLAAFGGPTLVDCLTRLDRLATDDRMPFLVPLLVGVLPGVAAAVLAERGSVRHASA